MWPGDVNGVDELVFTLYVHKIKKIIKCSKPDLRHHLFPIIRSGVPVMKQKADL